LEIKIYGLEVPVYEGIRPLNKDRVVEEGCSIDHSKRGEHDLEVDVLEGVDCLGVLLVTQSLYGEVLGLSEEL
jgi:hypothetical protein